MEKQTGRIVVGYDGSVPAGAALDWAAAEAERRSLPLTVLSVVNQLDLAPGLIASPIWLDVAGDTAKEIAEEGVRRARKSAPSVDLQAVTHVDTAAAALIRSSQEAALLVVGTRGRGEAAGALLGSVSFAISGHAHCPVVIVRGDSSEPAGPGRAVVVGTDGSPAAEVAVRYAAAVAAGAGAPLVVLTAYSTPAAQAWGEASVFTVEGGGPTFGSLAQEAAATTAAAAATMARAAHPDLVVTEVAAEGSIAGALGAAAAAAGLLVVGSRGRGGFAGLMLGSVGHHAIHSAPCPVAVVRT